MTIFFSKFVNFIKYSSMTFQYFDKCWVELHLVVTSGNENELRVA